ncbi:MAG: UbiD family decarboxylase [Deltaproteobacteria bacterium]|nr:UbiD family decarboxylase [Deltaproteobacteria bacterium]
MLYSDLRDWISKVEEFGELRKVEGVDWNLEIGAITEIYARNEPFPAILFDKIQGYPAGYRVLVGVHHQSLKKLCLTTHLSLDYGQKEFIAAWKERLNHPRMIAPRVVDSGPVLENVLEGKDIDLLSLPVPYWHENDGGRYLGTANVVISRDIDEGWVNLGCYRVMVHDSDTLALYISPGKHGRIMREKYFAQARPFPVAISFGDDPLLIMAAGNQLPWGSSEYDYAGGIRGEPFEVLIGPHTGLPIPAHSEITIEGEVWPDEHRREGPYGEWTGYYASGQRSEPVLKVKRMMHRNNPIITGAPSSRPPGGSDDGLIRAAFIWDYMEKAGVPDVKGVALYQGRFLIAVSIRQRYPGHAKQAGMIASQCRTGAYMGRYVVVVDDDTDVFDINDVLWAVCTRSDPEKDIDLLRRCWSSPLDPVLPKTAKNLNSRAIIDATRPYEWMKEFPVVSGASEDLKKRVIEIYGKYFA